MQALKQDEIQIVVQVNGKLRAKITVDANAKNNEIESIALVDENVVKFVEGKNIVKTIVVPNKLVNIVAR